MAPSKFATRALSQVRYHPPRPISRTDTVTSRPSTMRPVILERTTVPRP
jgi:hypothetical protein